MTVWFLTIGTSDVQIKSQNSWTRLFREHRSRLNTTVQFEPRQLDKDSRKPSLVHPRVMGVVYENENLDELVFPLLDNFRQEISRQNIVFGVGDRIVVILIPIRFLDCDIIALSQFFPQHSYESSQSG
jgi:hypothetical protein